MTTRVLCPYHDDTNPSMVVYGEWSHCFVCGANAKTEKLGLSDLVHIEDKKPADITANLEYIEGLSTKQIRGLELPYDSEGYYIVWPDKSYYKKRLWAPKENDRYRSPRGVQKPVFKYPSISSEVVIIEGEMNCLSLVSAMDSDESVCSPGPASEFLRYINYYLTFMSVTIIADKDAAGAVFGKELRDRLVFLRKPATLYCVEKDYNDVLTEEGQEALNKTFQAHKKMAM